jgi:esterase/lipase superfamily enzyme
VTTGYQGYQPPPRPLDDLLAELKEAVRARDRDRAIAIQQVILQRLVAEEFERDNTERVVRALMEELERPEAASSKPALFSLDAELSSEEPSHGGVIYPVWFGTNRQASADGSGFTGARGRRVSRGRVDVLVPEAHRFGETGSSFWKRLKRFDLRDDRLRVKGVQLQEPPAFFAQIQRTMQEARDRGEPPHALLFLHGYNSSFEEAAIRAAQIGVDLAVLVGGMGFFSWPSQGDPLAYPSDEAAIEASEEAIAAFLLDFMASSGADKVHVLAHSMGNRGLLRALQRIAANAEVSGKVKFGQIFLAAPDLDRDLFLDLAYLYPKYAERTTLYASDKDLPVHLSSKLHGAPRAGYFEPYTVAPNVDTVCVPGFDIDLLGHSYFSQAEALLYDISGLMRTNQAAPRQRMDPMVRDGQNFWSIRK